MVIQMKTTLNIDDCGCSDHVMRPPRGTTLSARAEAGLRRVLTIPVECGDSADALPALPSWYSGGQLPGTANCHGLYRLIQDEQSLVLAANVLARGADEDSGINVPCHRRLDEAPGNPLPVYLTWTVCRELLARQHSSARESSAPDPWGGSRPNAVHLHGHSAETIRS